MAEIKIGDKTYEAKATFKFEKLANERYSESGGQDIGGFMSIYLGLLQFDSLSLLAFWDCALQHYKKDRPSLDAIEDTLEELIIEDALQPFKDVFKVLDDSGFFKKRVKEIWTELEKEEPEREEETPEQAKEREDQKKMIEFMKTRRNELKGQTSTK